ncbi:methylenetetrahydrofolate reductase [NAD(P)H] [Alphaproteobacteria bacterium]|nr:methylenetetrahydrofolate reductase [NAD(P)H] [Alphaproteobacteria bacterium]MDC1157247.1 methylenetetrahydrofolate reductase [NAD(P)H] [Alphaproteobacteria bacterium]
MGHKPPKISFEFFPPKSLQASFDLWESLNVLAPLNPEFVSVTYGAGGTTRQVTKEMTEAIGKSYGLDVAAHLTCVNASKAETLAIAKSYVDAGVKQIVALRGDAPKGSAGFCPHPQGFADSVDLVAGLAATNIKTIHVGAYPEPHPEARNANADIDWLKRKIDAGATSAITQFFFDSEIFLRFRDRCTKAGIHVPIIPGILPIENWDNVKRFASRCGASIPASLDAEFVMAKRNEVEDILSVVVATDICSDLMDHGIDQFHFYTLNRPYLTRDVCLALGIVPDTKLALVA